MVTRFFQKEVPATLASRQRRKSSGKFVRCAGRNGSTRWHEIRCHPTSYARFDRGSVVWYESGQFASRGTSWYIRTRLAEKSMATMALDGDPWV